MADAADALSARSKVQDFLEAACSGDLEALRKFGSALDEEGKGAAAVAAGVRDANKRTALHFAAREGQTEVCKVLVEQLRLPVDPKDDDGETPLIHAARQGRLETVEYLLGRGADPSIASNMGATALHHAAGIGHIEIMKLLLGKGVDVESESESGTPLIWAAGHGQQDAVKLLLEQNAKPDTETADGITSLLSAVAAGSLPCLEVLIQAGANPNVTAGGATPLHIAADSGNLEMIKCLLQAGGDPNTSDDDGFKPIQVAALRDNLEVVEHLLPLTSPIPDVEHLLVMAPTWPEFLVKHFVNGCVNVVEQGITIPAMADMFYMKLAECMLSKAKVPVTKDDLTAQFQHFRRLWGCYQKDKQSVTLACSMESKNLKNKDAMMRNLKKEFDLNKYKDILKYEDQFNYIFPSCHIQNSTPVRAFMYNTGSSGDISVTSNRKRSIEEPFSRQLRQKSSDIDKPESSENGMTLDIALDELSVHDELSVLTYGIAAECLQDPIKLRAYSRLPTIEKKVQFLHVAWRLQYDPTSALAGLPPPS